MLGAYCLSPENLVESQTEIMKNLFRNNRFPPEFVLFFPSEHSGENFLPFAVFTSFLSLIN